MAAMDAMGALMMTAEELSNPMHISALIVLTPPEGAGPAFVDEIHRACQVDADLVDPRLRRRPHRGVDTGGAWTWRDADLDMSEHVFRTTLPAGSGREALWSFVGDVHAEPLDRSRPMWQVHVIDGFDGDRIGLLVKVHHSVVDGIGGIRMIESWVCDDPDRRGMQLFTAEPSRERDSSAGTRFPGPLALARSTVEAAAAGADFAVRLGKGGFLNVFKALTGGSATLPFSAPDTRFNGRLAPARSVAGAEISRARVRAVAKETGTTTNDVLTAVVAGVLRYWLLAHDELPDESLVAICPITVRSRDAASDDADANAFGVALCTLGTELDDPAQRLAAVHRSMSEAKEQVADLGSGASLAVALPAIAPTVLLPQIPFAPTPRPAFNLALSNVPGPPTDRYWNGAHLEAIYPVSTVYDGLALNITVCSYDDKLDIGYVAGREQLPDVETLIPLTERALSDLEAAVGIER
ncbi:wax ester/triacylglycerol synthase family O-acyltransferase [Rhodococcus sp. O3]|uniref:wax ester/triacylglycerol synthase family O-acyltransferase n=1 Tax=Rhodococcus sp. O3 TaxID=3404919 RepID=UPI003B67DE26